MLQINMPCVPKSTYCSDLSDINALMYLGRNTSPLSERSVEISSNLSALPSASKTEVFKYPERSVYRQTADIHNACLFYNVMGIIIFIDNYRYPVRRIGNLGNCIYNQSVIFFSVVRGYNIQAVTDFKQSGKIVLSAVSLR